MYLVEKNDGCCGLGEISGVSIYGPKEGLLSLIGNSNGYHSNYNFREPVLIFTGAGRGKTPPLYAKRFKRFIEDNNLGTVIMLPVATSRNATGNYIFVYHWNVNKANLKKWYKDNK